MVAAISNPYNRQITLEEQKLYDHLLYWIDMESPEDMLERFYALFIDGSQYPDAEIAQALHKVVNSRTAYVEFRYVLNRCCHILINRWQTRASSLPAVLDLISMFEEVPIAAGSQPQRSRTVQRQRELLRRFFETEQYQTLCRLAQVLNQTVESAAYSGNRPLGSLIRRYPYLYEYCLLSEDCTSEQQHTVKQIQTNMQRKFEIDLSQYITYQVRRAQSDRDILLHPNTTTCRVIQPVANPTLLSDEDFNHAIKHYVGRVDGSRTYKDLAHGFLIHSAHRQTFRSFKDDLYEYITASVDSAYGKRQFNQQLHTFLQGLLPESNYQDLDDFLMVRTCSQLFNFLVVDSPKQPNHYLFIDLITNLGPVLTTGILLKILLLCRRVKPALERRFSILFSHYESYTRDAVQWLVVALENLHVALSTHFGSVDVSLIR
ncbi:hypothetical protein ACQ4M4_02665 [Leptolyngbya sp. AN02str]|uniref:hypothetical protein n=1 Tax=Leptolyngbya sp. AN02str TaxID=3423363 RepID=UPI003D31FDD1